MSVDDQEMGLIISGSEQVATKLFNGKKVILELLDSIYYNETILHERVAKGH